MPDGKAPFVEYFIGFLVEDPGVVSEMKRSAASGDLVCLHVRSKPAEDDLGWAVVDIFRVEDGMVVEHWDDGQPVQAEFANDNTMFREPRRDQAEGRRDPLAAPFSSAVASGDL